MLDQVTTAAQSPTGANPRHHVGDIKSLTSLLRLVEFKIVSGRQRECDSVDRSLQTGIKQSRM
jgi:hypothetical protein